MQHRRLRFMGSFRWFCSRPSLSKSERIGVFERNHQETLFRQSLAGSPDLETVVAWFGKSQ